eukprot:CAMPEP_0197298746 /NCGR_PEP_ID=MMETSP0890-20130614/44274_1 /TAXON_ID=44058 ORGANISM="Aureoumbra lagunensis, Strain CCMP1510" /NCGR_SAMPLE_ID=MMETSP0890 /ASSEMBLY_ACC=CAM_ASM_000533 /LENGTH=124 /DNA_ID=CAMNT_0042776667 /DNA_START=197 /DNA_END=571 /DNA_ORIENTATION=+
MALHSHPQTDDLERADKNPRRSQLSAEKKRYIAKLIAKHGNNYESMVHDLTANPEQLTVAKLKKLATKFYASQEKKRENKKDAMDIDTSLAQQKLPKVEEDEGDTSLKKKKRKKKKKKDKLLIM